MAKQFQYVAKRCCQAIAKLPAASKLSLKMSVSELVIRVDNDQTQIGSDEIIPPEKGIIFPVVQIWPL